MTSEGSELRIGLSACFFHPDPTRNIFKGKTLLYLEQSLAHWLMRHGALPVLVPTSHADFSPAALVQQLHGLVLHGGDDVAPESYGERPRKPEWAGDRVRDDYERALIEECLATSTPLLGVCRGVQILNVALGGTLMQDIASDQPGALVHRDRDAYDRLLHDVRFEPDSYLARLFGCEEGRVNSVHHQAVRTVGRDLVIEARSPRDGIVEALRYTGDTYAIGVQWHPEFQDVQDASLLDASVVVEDFLRAAERQRVGRGSGVTS